MAKRDTPSKTKGETVEKTCNPCPTACILRIALGFVFLYASIMKLFFGAAPPVDQILTFMPADVSLFLLGLVEFIIGFLLVFGLFTRVAGWAATVLFAIFLLAGISLSASGKIPGLWSDAWLWKDVVLIAAALHVARSGAPCCSIDAWIKKKANT